MSKKLSLTLILAICASFASLLKAAELDDIGRFDFPTSGDPAAQEHFLRGVGFLHSFGMTQAGEEFRKAQEIDGDFAMAYWGEAFTYQHPFFGAKDERPGQALMKLGATSAERLSKAPTEREKGFIRAAEAYALTVGGMSERRLAWMNAMADLYQQFPDDREVAAFYAVSTLSGARATASGTARERLNMRAGALALELFKENEDHPGAAHYVIHAFDDPVHAPIALEAAFKYADTAPAVSHARHMPTHIFIQHGKWNEVSQWNESAFNAAYELWKPGDTVGDQNHSSDWGQYGDLQLGDLERSKLWISRAEQVLKNNPSDNRSAGTLSTMRARHTIESQHWNISSYSEDLSATELLALGLSAVALGDLELANKVADRMAEMVSDSPNSGTLKISQLEIAGLAKLAEAKNQIAKGMNAAGLPMQTEALALLEEAVDLANKGRKPSGAANPLKPAHELGGEAFLAVGQAEKAAELFEQSLLRMPNRPLSLLGAARSYKEMDNAGKASEKYAALLAVWSDDSHPAVQEAKKYLNY